MDNREIVVQFPAQTTDFFLRSIHTGSGVDTDSTVCRVVTKCECAAHNAPQSIVGVKIEWRNTSVLPREKKNFNFALTCVKQKNKQVPSGYVTSRFTCRPVNLNKMRHQGLSPPLTPASCTTRAARY